MGQIFQSFIGGVEAGDAQREQRDRRTALDEAGRLYRTGNAEGAENALMSAGLTQEAANFSALAEARRARTARTRAQEAAQSLGPNADPSAIVRAQSDSYFQGGDVEQGANLYNIYHQMDEGQRQQSLAAHDGIASFSLGLIQSGVPEDQRQAQALAHAQDFSEQTGIPVEQVQQMVQRQTDWSDAGLQALAAAHRSASDQLMELTRQRERGEDIARDERHFNIQQANAREGRGLGAPQIRQFGNDYERGLGEIEQAIGPQITNAMPWALQVAQTGDVPEGVDRDTALINDQGMLRAVARLQTGVGVLTEGEVRDTVGNDIYNQMQAGGAAFRLNTRLRPEVRQALANLVQSGVGRASQRAWQYRDNSIAEYQAVNNGQTPTGWGYPSLPHPQDVGALSAAEQLARSGQAQLRPNDVRIAPSGREYIYMGPGNWLPRGEGNTQGYQAGRDQRIARGGAPEVPVSAPRASARSDGLPNPADFQPNTVIAVGLDHYRLVNGDWRREATQPGGYTGR